MFLSGCLGLTKQVKESWSSKKVDNSDVPLSNRTVKVSSLPVYYTLSVPDTFRLCTASIEKVEFFFKKWDAK